jgi:hypothetical protein
MNCCARARMAEFVDKFKVKILFVLSDRTISRMFSITAVIKLGFSP